MSLESSELVVAGTGRVMVAPANTARPANISTEPEVHVWIDLGYTTPDGVHFVFERNSKDLFGWQSFDPLRTLRESEPKRVDFSLMQWNQNTWVLASGGGSFSTEASGQYLFTPPDAGEVDYRAFIVELVDDDKTYRFYAPKALNKSPLDFSGRRDDSANLAISMSILAPDSGSAWYLQTDDTNLGVAASAGS